MLGAIVGDIIGSPFEHARIKTKTFDLFSRYSVFTDDTVQTVAIADSLLNKTPYRENLRSYFLAYPNAGYGGRFRRWARSAQMKPYGSFGNGSAMRVSPIAWFYEDLESVMEEAMHSAEVTHNHPDGVRGAQAVASAVYMARTGSSKVEIKAFVERAFAYDLSETIDEIRPEYDFDVSCQGSVPQAILCFLEAENYEDAVRNAVSLGGDSDTLACMAGSIAEAYFGGVPSELVNEALKRLNPSFVKILETFRGHVGASQGDLQE